MSHEDHTGRLHQSDRHAALGRDLSAAFCWQRRRDIIDGLVDLLVLVIHRIGVRAERKVVQEPLRDLQRVDGKTTLLYKWAEAALEQPEGIVKDVLFPIVGEPTLNALVKEYRAQGFGLPALCPY
jgi:hypothetical protein